MVNPPFDEYLNTPNKSIRQNVMRRGVVLHHAAMTSLSGLQYLAMGGKQVSATAICKDDISKQLMTDEFRAWSLSSAWGDSSFRSVETCNQSTDGYTISDASHWELAYLVAYWAERDGFWPHRTGASNTWTVIGHREAYTIWDISYATACPGSMDLNLVTARAQEILNGSSAPTPSGKQEDMEFRVIKDSNPAVAVVYDSTTYTEIDSKTDPVEFAASESAHGAGANRMFITPDHWRIEKIQIAKRAATQAKQIAAAVKPIDPAVLKTLLEQALANVTLPAPDVDEAAIAASVRDKLRNDPLK